MDLQRARRDAKALLRAARAGNPAALARLDAQGVRHRDPLLLADAQLAVARELGAPSWPALTSSSDGPRWAALGRAAAAGDHARVRALLKQGAAVGPSMALTCALARDDADLVSLLLAHGDPDLSGEDWPELRDALIAAIHRGCSARVMETLRGGGAHPNPLDEYGRPASLLAWRWGRDDFGGPGPLTDGDHFSRACWRGDRETARALAEEDGLEDDALVWAARAGNLAAVELLIDVGKVPVNRRGDGGMPALEHARNQGHADVERALLDRGADPDVIAPQPARTVVRAGLDVRLHAAWMRNLAATVSRAEVWRVGDGLALRTGIEDNTWNGVIASRASSHEVSTALARLSDVPAIWTVPGAGALGRRLVAAGADEESTAVVVQGERRQLRLERPSPLGLSFDQAAPESWAALGDEGLQADTSAASPAMRLAVAREAGHVVAVGALLVDGEAALLVDILVAPGRRHRGIGTALVAHLLNDAPDVEIVVAEPTPDSQAFWWLLGLVPAPATPEDDLLPAEHPAIERATLNPRPLGP